MNEFFIKSSANSYLKKRAKELIWSIECFISIALTCISVIVMFILFEVDSKLYISVISNLILTFIGGLITMIAFSLSALALVLSIFKTAEIERISTNGNNLNINLENDKNIIEKKVEIFAMLIYRFYASGILNLVAIIMLILGYFVVNFPFHWSNWILGIITFLITYIVYFSLIFTVLLIPTCIRFKFIEYIDTKNQSNDSDNNA